MADALGDRMKRYETAHRTTLPPRTYAVIRVDGRAFHTYLRGANKPYDFDFMYAMGQIAAELCREIQGAVFGYQQSDEISVLLTDWASHTTQPWFGGEVQKIVSLAAAIATGVIYKIRGGTGAPMFDARVFTLPCDTEVGNYFLWRQRDAVRNSILMAGQAKFSARELHGKHTGQIQEMLFQQHGINWDQYSVPAKRGQVAFRMVGSAPVTYTDRRSGEQVGTEAVRSWWAVDPAPHFTLDPDGWLVTHIPPLPTLQRPVAPDG